MVAHGGIRRCQPVWELCAWDGSDGFQREGARTTTTRGAAASCCCGSVSIDMLVADSHGPPFGEFDAIVATPCTAGTEPTAAALVGQNCTSALEVNSQLAAFKLMAANEYMVLQPTPVPAKFARVPVVEEQVYLQPDAVIRSRDDQEPIGGLALALITRRHSLWRCTEADWNSLAVQTEDLAGRALSLGDGLTT